MAVAIKKTNGVKGKFKGIMVKDGKFIDNETGELVDVAAIAQRCMGEQPFDLSISVKSVEELDGSN